MSIQGNSMCAIKKKLMNVNKLLSRKYLAGRQKNVVKQNWLFKKT